MISWCDWWKPVKESEFDFELIKRHWNYILNLTNDTLSEDRTILEKLLEKDKYQDSLDFKISKDVKIRLYPPTFLNKEKLAWMCKEDANNALSFAFTPIVSDWNDFDDDEVADIMIYPNKIDCWVDIPKKAFKKHEAEYAKIEEWISKMQEYFNRVNGFKFSEGQNQQISELEEEIKFLEDKLFNVKMNAFNIYMGGIDNE